MFIAVTKLVAQLRTRCDFRTEYHEIETNDKIVSEIEKARNISLALT